MALERGRALQMDWEKKLRLQTQQRKVSSTSSKLRMRNYIPERKLT